MPNFRVAWQDHFNAEISTSEAYRTKTSKAGRGEAKEPMIACQ